ncbi:FeoC-like transcriptional regulator [Thiolapillus sp.]
MLSDIRAYLQERGQASLSDIARHLDVTPEVARDMLQLWLKKGKVQRIAATPSCGSSCSQCDPATTEIYVWGEAEGRKRFVQQKCSLS